jgi:arsenate reductase
MLTVYTYQKCSTCRAATRWLQAHGIAFTERAIRESPPGIAELGRMLDAVGSIGKICNSSGVDYRALGLAAKLPLLGREEILGLLATNGNLVKRPFAQDPERGIHLCGFKPIEWETAFATRINQV